MIGIMPTSSSNTMPNPLPTLQMGPCGSPCESPCSEDERKDKPVDEPTTAIYNSLKNALVNAMDLCFDNVYEEPKRILMIGGCRQISLAQHIALLLPAVEITLVDSDEAIVAATKEAICCRFKFVSASLEQLPYDSNHFDLTIAHHFHAYPKDWKMALSEACRVTSKNIMVTLPRKWQWNLGRALMGQSYKEALVALGASSGSCCPPVPETFDWLTQLTLYAKIKSRYAPFPWAFQMCEIKDAWEERLILN